ncbi:hypothetical protein Ga0074812_10447 [Parafrankia irregularis]|uniref:Uncharacterized protein n=1 Tax=Parafrankia irregularis TaxID=795642 RepID=A0A0S4QHL9_9ACTN|nr:MULTISPECIES: hypothetical protein [Parafrankia]MBE3204157.1 hypothetical protein [Parafrankia sp. CH37]CUU54967.1 hypothetical protein Ga0074812_10447 [Parafrankia irregularis]
MTPRSPLVPVALRPVVLIARMAALPELTQPEDIARILATFTPPIDPASPEWAALRAALDRYDTARDQTACDAARRQIVLAAVTLLLGPPGHSPPETPARCRVPAQRTPSPGRHG